MQKQFHCFRGQPIFSTDKAEIWAYWKENMTFASNMFDFHTMSQLLNVPTFIGNAEYVDHTSHRKCYCYFTQNTWLAGVGTTQKDFGESPHFILSPISGPETVKQAIDVLLDDVGFKQFFGDEEANRFRFDQSSVYEKLRQFASFNEGRRRNY